MRRQVPLAITFFVGIIMIFSAYVPHAPFDRLNTDLTDFFMIIAAFAFLLGGGNLCKMHLQKAASRKPGWGFSVVILAAFGITLAAGLFKIGNPEGITGALDLEGSMFDFMYTYFLYPLSSTMFSLLAFYVASASYRAFRAKNPEAAMLLVSAFFILLGRTVVGDKLTGTLPGIIEIFFAVVFLYIAWRFLRAKRQIAAGVLAIMAAFFVIWAGYGWFANEEALITTAELVSWIMFVPQMAGQRAIMIGICLGVISMSLRLILGVERGHLGSDAD